MNKIVANLFIVAVAAVIVGCTSNLGPTDLPSVQGQTSGQARLTTPEIGDAGSNGDQEALEALIAEVDPHVVYHDGSWSLDPNAKLTPQAQAFVTQALTASAGMRIEAPEDVSALAVAGGVRSLTAYWWGYRIGLKSGDAQAVSLAWRTSGASSAIKVFLGYFGYSGWAVGAAGLLVPTYAVTIAYVDKQGGYRGVFLNVPWTIVPTVITAQR